MEISLAITLFIKDLTLVLFSIPNFNLLSYVLDLNFYIESFLMDIILNQNHTICNLTVPSEKSKIASFASSIMQNIVGYLTLPDQVDCPDQNDLSMLVPTVLASATDGCSCSLTEIGNLGRWLIL